MERLSRLHRGKHGFIGRCLPLCSHPVFCYRPLSERLYFASLKGLELLETLFYYAATIGRNGICLFSSFFSESMWKVEECL